MKRSVQYAGISTLRSNLHCSRFIEIMSPLAKLQCYKASYTPQASLVFISPQSLPVPTDFRRRFSVRDIHSNISNGGEMGSEKCFKIARKVALGEAVCDSEIKSNKVSFLKCCLVLVRLTCVLIVSQFVITFTSTKAWEYPCLLYLFIYSASWRPVLLVHIEHWQSLEGDHSFL